MNNLHPIQRAFVWMVIGDAIGTGHEFEGADHIKDSWNPNQPYSLHALSREDDTPLKRAAVANGFVPARPHMRGLFSDDAQMSFGVAQCIIEDGRLTLRRLAHFLLLNYKQNPVPRLFAADGSSFIL